MWLFFWAICNFAQTCTCLYTLIISEYFRVVLPGHVLGIFQGCSSGPCSRNISGLFFRAMWLFFQAMWLFFRAMWLFFRAMWLFFRAMWLFFRAMWLFFRAMWLFFRAMWLFFQAMYSTRRLAHEIWKSLRIIGCLFTGEEQTYTFLRFLQDSGAASRPEMGPSGPFDPG
ncbi:hypothetical protein EDB83DRAFT_2319134 [Lactarius deliciosus]|nr:hypothetical protein EDB83DRAFT_2319134 [Lactarius deliciosus]